jgi:hypothetical protein
MVRILVEKIKAGYPAIYLQTHEEERALGYIDEAATETGRKVFTWLFKDGIVSRNKTAKGTQQRVAQTGEPEEALREAIKLDQNSVLILRLFHHFMDDKEVQALLYDLLPKYKATRRQVIIISPILAIPPELEKILSLIEMPLPTKEEHAARVDNMQTNIDKPDPEQRKLLAENARGLTQDEAENAIALSMIRPNIGKTKGEKMVWDPNVVKDEKCETVKKTGYLYYQPATGHSIEDIGGLGLFKKWVERRAAIFKNYDAAREFGCDVPKGVLMLGVPGTGKSLGAKATADAFQLPLIRVDMGAIFGGIVGQSEANARAVIKFLEAVSPCVGWLDEVEKGFAGSSGGQLDSGVGARVLGTFLTWMQDKTAPVFIYATANNIAALPPELLRKGRFDEMFYVQLPNQTEREEIFKIHITKRGRAAKIGKPLDIKQLAAMTKGFSGAEIEAVVKEALDEAFFVKKDLNMFDLQEAITNVVPLEVLMKDDIDRLSKWAQGRTRPANLPEGIESPHMQDRTVEA